MKPISLRYKTLLNFSFISVLTMGCFYQIYTICEMFFKYPTNVLIETKFDAIERKIPVISICSTYQRKYPGVNSGDIFAQIQLKQMLIARVSSNSFHSIKNVSSYIWQNSIEVLSSTHYCLTTNSLMKGKIT